MLGLVRGRLYYNLLNWYRVLALLPGFQVNRRFMEQMMGVKEALPDALAGEIASETSRGARARRVVRWSRTVGGPGREPPDAQSPRSTRFYERLDARWRRRRRRSQIGVPTSWSRTTATCERRLLLAGTRRSSTISSR